MGENWYDRQRRRVENIKAAESAGEAADSMGVRLALIAKMDAGEITLPEVQAELARVKRGARKAGKITRAQAWRGHRADQGTGQL